MRLLAHQTMEAYLARLPLQPCLALMLQAAAQQWAEPCTEPAALQVKRCCAAPAMPLRRMTGVHGPGHGFCADG